MITSNTPFIRLRSFISVVNKNLVEKMSQLKFNSIDLMCLRLIMLLTPNEEEDLENPILVSCLRDQLFRSYEQLIEYNRDISGIFVDYLVALQPSPYIQNYPEINASITNKFVKTVSLLFNLSIISKKLVDEAIAFHEIPPVQVMPFMFTYIFNGKSG